MNEHLSVDELADVLAGEGSSEHLAGCSGCTQRLRELEAALPRVDADLTDLIALPLPPMPAGLDDRITAALQAEAAAAPSAADADPVTADAPVPATATPSTATASATVTPILPPSRRPLTRWLPAAAAGLVVVVGGGIGLTVALHGSGSTPSSDTAGPTVAAVAKQVARSDTGTAYTKANAVATLTTQLPALLRGAVTPTNLVSPEVAPHLTTTGVDPLANLRTTTGLASCLASLSDPSDPGLPLAIDYVTYAGKPALVVVLPSTEADKVDIFIVAATCTQANDHTLDFVRLTKP